MNNEVFNKFYKNTDTFEYYNANPEGAKKRGYSWDRADCSIRSLAKAADMEWLEAFDFLSYKARRDFNVLNGFKGFRKWMVESGASWNHCKAEKGKSRMNVETFAKTHPTGSYIIEVAGHFTACVNGKIYDTFNCGDKCVVGYYDMVNFQK